MHFARALELALMDHEGTLVPVDVVVVEARGFTNTHAGHGQQPDQARQVVA